MISKLKIPYAGYHHFSGIAVIEAGMIQRGMFWKDNITSALPLLTAGTLQLQRYAGLK